MSIKEFMLKKTLLFTENTIQMIPNTCVCVCSGLRTKAQSFSTHFTFCMPISSHSTPHHCHQSSRCAPSLPPSLHPSLPTKQKELERRIEIMDNSQTRSHLTGTAWVTSASWMYFMSHCSWLRLPRRSGDSSEQRRLHFSVIKHHQHLQ